ncbi:MAG: capsular polysaccharide biosynthesis protein CapF, partial [Oscillospiraceae bacterium]
EFRESRRTLVMPSLRNGLDSALYATYLTYLDSDDFAYTLNAHSDARGAFAEIMRSLDAGQISFSTTAPGITRGNHWHHSKNEKFVVISGQATVRFRRIDGDAVNEYNVCGERPTVIDIPPGYTHNITNSSPCDVMVMLIWASELFDPERTDTYPMEV